MKATLRALSTALVGLAMAACHGGPTGPRPPDTFKLVATMTNDSGAATMVDAVANIDNTTVSSSCDTDATGDCINSPVAAFNFTGAGHLAPGIHSLSFFVDDSTTDRPLSYTVSGCTLQIFDENAKLIKNLMFGPTTLSLPLGTAMTFSFSF